jgi:predicted hydrocarbon binding protein
MDTAQNIIQTLDLDRFFSQEDGNYDLLAGEAYNAAGSRVIYLSTDVVQGIYQALLDETGPAWCLILKNCGILWGRRVARHLERELKLMFNAEPSALPLAEFIRLIEGYFAAHGWGLLKLNLDKAESHGLVTASFENSLFSEVLTEETKRVDYLVSGILQSIFSHISGQELACEEIASIRAGASKGMFVITAASRLEPLEEKIENGDSSEAIIEALSKNNE